MTRANYLLHTDQQLLHDWAYGLKDVFVKSYGPFHVGSSLSSPTFRDVDVRQILPDEVYDKLAELLDIEQLGIAFSLYGQKMTGLPIDYQVQRMSDANSEYSTVRSSLAIKMTRKFEAGDAS